MISIWCVCVGNKYSNDDVYKLWAMCEANMPEPFAFKCLSDRRIPGVFTLVPNEVWPGWWSKLLLFRYATGPCLYLDLDVVIVGDLSRLKSGKLSLPANWAQSGHGGCQSSVMAWDSRIERLGWLADNFRPAELTAPTNGNHGYYHGLWGDQEYITQQLGSPGGPNIKPMTGVYSYKYHCQSRPPDDAAVVCFHGNPKPKEVTDEWVRNARSFTLIPACHTRLTMVAP